MQVKGVLYSSPAPIKILVGPYVPDLSKIIIHSIVRTYE